MKGTACSQEKILMKWGGTQMIKIDLENLVGTSPILQVFTGKRTHGFNVANSKLKNKNEKREKSICTNLYYEILVINGNSDNKY